MRRHPTPGRDPYAHGHGGDHQRPLDTAGGAVLTDGPALLRRLVMSEVLAPPLALRGPWRTLLAARRRPARRGEE